MARYKVNERIDEFEACANTLGWSYKKEDEWGLIKWLLDFKLFRQGHRQKITPIIIHKSDDLGFTCSFDYIYTISSGKSSHTYRQTVYFRYSKSLALPHFVMVPEKWYHRIGTYFGMQDIDFVQYPTFSKNYLLRGEDEEYIRYHFDNPEMVRYFDNQDLYSLEGMNYLMILYIHNVVLPQQQILQLVNIGNTLHNFLAGKTPSVELPEYEYPI
ncbi:MAG TPA: hypothetical protein VFG10_02360 [Saprospiraceae bacterium]|nr:hypothetical protein [Saprospiraceae bacterium]